jgi:hypothetical protein
MKRQMEGNNDQRRKAAREARRRGKLPSEERATLGASKQLRSAPRNASHQERVEGPHRGKANPGTKDRARPGNREFDPKRTSDWT